MPIRTAFPAAVAALLLATAAHAQALHRCIGAHGEPTFTDQPCSAALQTEIQPAHAQAHSGLTDASCARTEAELADSVRAAFASGDSIRLSGLVLWNGYPGRSSSGILRQLATLVREPLMDVEVVLAGTAEADETHDEMGQQEMLVRTGRSLDRVPRVAETRFALTRSHGCWWLQPPL